MREERERPKLSKKALEVLDIIIENSIAKIDYNKPERTLGGYIDTDHEKIEKIIKEIRGATSNVLVSRAKTIPLLGWEYNVRYIVDLDEAKRLYDEQKAMQSQTQDNEPQ